MKKILFIIMALATAAVASAQNADKLYEEGKALYEKKDYTAALPKLRAAAEKGKKGAIYRLARCYDKGHGVAEDNKQAIRLYQQAADKGHAKSQYQLGKAYMNGKKGLQKDEQKARTWLSKAVKNGEDGSKILKKIRQDAKSGDEDAKKMLTLLGK